jgi:hypothetical protein
VVPQPLASQGKLWTTRRAFGPADGARTPRACGAKLRRKASTFEAGVCGKTFADNIHLHEIICESPPFTVNLLLRQSLFSLKTDVHQ